MAKEHCSNLTMKEMRAVEDRLNAYVSDEPKAGVPVLPQSPIEFATEPDEEDVMDMSDNESIEADSVESFEDTEDNDNSDDDEGYLRGKYNCCFMCIAVDKLYWLMRSESF